MDFRGAFNAVTKPFRKPEGYVSAKEEQAARPPAPTPPPAENKIGGMNMGVTAKREKAAGMKNGGMVARGAYRPKMMEGGMVRGPGTATSDSIPATVKKGSYILPADTTEDVALSNGEMNLPPDTVAAIGAAVLNVVRNATHEFAAGDAAEDAAEGDPHAEDPMMAEAGESDPRGFKNGGHVGMERKGYAAGDPVGDEAKLRADRLAAGLAPNLNPATSMQVRPESMRSTGIYGTPRPPAPEGSWVEAPRAAPAAVARPAPAAPALPALATRTLEPSATGTVLGQAAVDANSAAARGDYAQAVSQGVRGLAGAIPALAVDTAGVFAPAARGFGNVVSTLFTGEPMQDTAPAAATPQPVARPVTPAVAQPATQPDSVRGRGQPVAQPTATVPPPPGTIISPTRGVYGNVTGDTAFDNRGAISPQNDAAATALDARYRQQAAGERAMAEQAAAADPRALLMGQFKSMADRNQVFSAKGAQVLAGLSGADAQQRAEAGRLALENRRAATAEQESGARTQLTGMEIAKAKRLGQLQAKFEASKDPEERKTLRDQILLEQGKDKPMPAPKWIPVPGGQSIDPATQQVIRDPSGAFNPQTGEYMQLGQAAKPPLGAVKAGYRFKGGNPADQKNWEKV